MGLTLVRAESRGPTDIEKSLARLDTEKLDALLLLNDSTLVGNAAVRADIIDFARDHRLPSASTQNDYARSGGLLSLGTDMNFIGRRAAEYVHRIIEGGRAGDLPVERPTKFRLSVNLDTAKTLGLTVPQSIVARADEVIE
jgi:putative tryptophan/tyrosine transport system substrate-binding protein